MQHGGCRRAALIWNWSWIIHITFLIWAPGPRTCDNMTHKCIFLQNSLGLYRDVCGLNAGRMLFFTSFLWVALTLRDSPSRYNEKLLFDFISMRVWRVCNVTLSGIIALVSERPDGQKQQGSRLIWHHQKDIKKSNKVKPLSYEWDEYEMIWPV